MDAPLTVFATERTAILDALSSISTVSKDKVSSEIDSLQQRLVKLNALYTQHASSLPTYEQKRCQEQLKQLTERISSEKLKYIPKQRFSFKSRSKSESPSTSAPATPPAVPIVPEETNTIRDSGVSFSTSNAYLSTAHDLHPSNIRLLSMSNSVVNLLQPKQHATLQAKGLSNCLVIASEFDGAVHLTNLSDCVVVLKCHQFRLHDSRDTIVYLSCSSRPIIENSLGIGFAAYPAVIGRRLGIADLDEEEWLVKELVEDFNWLRREHSPNWRILQNRVGEEIWAQVLEIIDGEACSPSRLLELVMNRCTLP